jgi:hypothetical protein
MGVSFVASPTNMKAFLFPFIAFLLVPELAVGITRHYKFNVCANFLCVIITYVALLDLPLHQYCLAHVVRNLNIESISLSTCFFPF